MTTLLALLFTTLPCHADLGPKPTMYFQWKERGKIDPAQVELLQCNDSACKGASPLKQNGPQHFQCCNAGCGAMAYGFGKYSQLRAKLGGKEVTSNSFQSSEREGRFEISESKGKIEVSESKKDLTEDEKSKLLFCQ